MSRIIKFRAWNKPTKQMYHWGFFHDVFRKGAADSRNFEPEHNEFMQFTGLLDRHGKEIYEGDVIFFVDNEGKKIIEFKDGEFTINKGMASMRDVISIDEKNNGVNIEIIGNIYENPDLLDKSKTNE